MTGDWFTKPAAFTHGTLTHARPKAGRLAKTAMQEIAAAERLRACRHAASGRAKALAMCAQHLEAGVLCERCYRRHVRGHPVDIEHSCDGCGALVQHLSSVVTGRPIDGVVLTDGQHRAVALGDVIVAGIGLCRQCRSSVEGRDAP